MGHGCEVDRAASVGGISDAAPTCGENSNNNTNVSSNYFVEEPEWLPDISPLMSCSILGCEPGTAAPPAPATTTAVAPTATTSSVAFNLISARGGTAANTTGSVPSCAASYPLQPSGVRLAVAPFFAVESGAASEQFQSGLWPPPSVELPKVPDTQGDAPVSPVALVTCNSPGGLPLAAAGLPSARSCDGNLSNIADPSGSAFVTSTPAGASNSLGRMSPFEPTYSGVLSHYRRQNVAHGLPSSSVVRAAADLLRMVASRQPLSAAQSEALEEYLATATYNDLIETGFSPAMFDTILESNTAIATRLLVAALDTPDDALYLSCLLKQSPTNTDRLLFCLRIISDISCFHTRMPEQPLSHFIAVAFDTCYNIREPARQQRVARLICVFLLELVQKCWVCPTDNIAPEALSFAVSWIQLREASTLFRALKGCHL